MPSWQAPRRLETRPLHNTVLKKTRKNSCLIDSRECNCKSASPQRYTQESLINNDIFHNTPLRYMHIPESQDTITTHEAHLQLTH